MGVTDKMAEFCRSVGKDHAWKESEVMTQGKRDVKLGTLLLSNDENNVIAENAFYL